MMEYSMKCVVVGDRSVGKTSLLMSYTSNLFPKNYIPTVYENHSVKIMVGKFPFTFNLFDTAGQESYETVRPLAYPKTNLFLVCFSVVNPRSFENVKSIWVPEITYFRKNTPFLLVGTKIDQRNKPIVIENLAKLKCKVISRQQGVKLARKLKAVKYVECSSLTQDGLNNVFSEAIRAIVFKPRVSKGKCTIF